MSQSQRITALTGDEDFSVFSPSQKRALGPVNTERRSLSTAAVHAGEEREKYGNAITDPIFCSSTFTFSNTQAVIDYIEQKQPRAEYGRYGSPGERR